MCTLSSGCGRIGVENLNPDGDTSCEPMDTVSCYDGDSTQRGAGSCVEGISRCIDGKWTPCEGQVVAEPEFCDARDNDCDGQTDDDIEPLRCGFGACETEQEACVGGEIATCPAPAPAPESCNGVDDDCDGVVDELAECCDIFVSPGGRAGAAGSKDDPLSTVGDAIALARDRGGARIVCLASDRSGGECREHIYREDIVMEDGVSLHGGFDPETWIAGEGCPTVLLADAADRGLTFGAKITGVTALSSLIVRARDDETAPTAAITIRGATGAVLQNVTVTGASAGGETVGVDIGEDASVVITGGSILGGGGADSSVGILVVNSRLDLRGVCGGPLAEGHEACESGCDGGGVRGALDDTPLSAIGIRLENAGGSVIEQSSVCAGATERARGIDIEGDAEGLRIARSTVRAAGAEESAALHLASCGGASPRIRLNPAIIADGPSEGGTRYQGIRVSGDCHPVIVRNTSIIGAEATVTDGSAAGIACTEDDDGVPSRCIVALNDHIAGSADAAPASAVGIRCDGASCRHIVGNPLISSGRSGGPTGMSLGSGSTAVVEANHIKSGCPLHGIATGLSLVDSSARIINNWIEGGRCESPGPSESRIGIFMSLDSPDNESSVHSNTIFAGGEPGSGCDAHGIHIGATYAPSDPVSRGVIRNNIIQTGNCDSGLHGFYESHEGGDPRIVENNAFYFERESDALYFDIDTRTLITALGSLHGLEDISARDNVEGDPGLSFDNGFPELTAASTLCIDTGTPVNAPRVDYRAVPRPQRSGFDIGAFELE